VTAVLVDTNILLRIVDGGHAMHESAKNAVAKLLADGDNPRIAAQNIIEFRAVVTRPISANGLGLSQVQAEAEIASVKSLYDLLPESAQILSEWERIVNAYHVEGKQNHDAHIVAAMAVHGVNKILTFNKEDFARYKEITATTPNEQLGLV